MFHLNLYLKGREVFFVIQHYETLKADLHLMGRSKRTRDPLLCEQKELSIVAIWKTKIRGIQNNWFKSYISNRKQFVFASGTKSTFLEIKHGVPQGSVLGPLLFFNLYQWSTGHQRDQREGSEGKSRPLKIVFNTLHEKRNLFNNLKALKEVERYRNISVSDV